MSVSDGQAVNAEVTNAAYISRIVDSSTIGKITLNNGDSPSVVDTQAMLGDISDAAGIIEGSLTNKDYTSNNFITDGENHKEALAALDVALKSVADDLQTLDDREALNNSNQQGEIDDHTTRITDLETLTNDHETRIYDLENSTMEIQGDKTFTGNVTVNGDFEVLGTLTSLNTTNTEIADQNITLNKNGNDATSIGSGITIERTTTNAGIQFDNSLTSKWKLGMIGALYEVVVSGIAQTISGIKDFSSGIKTDNINESTLNAGVTIETVLVKDGLVDGRDVATDGTTLDNHLVAVDPHPQYLTAAEGALAFDPLGAAADVQTNLETHTDDLNNPHATTKAHVGLDNVTDDAQLKRSASDFSSFTLKTTPVDDDLFLIEDSEDSFNKKKVKKSSIGGGDGGGGSKNYISNGKADTGTTGWAVYQDAAQSNPVDGIGGAPSITLVASASSPLSGSNSFLITKDAVNRQGEGVSYDFTIDASDKGKVIALTFNYAINSGVYADDDLAVWIYDVTNAALIQPAPYLIKNHGLVSDTFFCEFQTSLSSSYRLIIHVKSTSALAYSFKFDDVNLGPQGKIWGSPVLGEVAYTPTFGAGWGAVTGIECWVSRDADYDNYRLKFTSGTRSSASSSISLRPGTKIDSFKVPNTATFGYLWHGDVADTTERTIVGTALNGYVEMGRAFTGNSLSSTQFPDNISGTGPITINAQFRIPVLGAESTVIMSNDADTRIVAARATGTPAGASAGQPIIFPTITFDTHGAYNNTTGRYLVQSSGLYEVTCFLDTTASGLVGYIYLDGVLNIPILITQAQSVGGGSGFVMAKAGQFIDVRPSQAINFGGCNVSFVKVLGPAQIASSESVNAAYYANTNGSASPLLPIDFNTLEHDSHGSVTTGSAWKFTAKESGKFSLKGGAHLSTNVALKVYKNGVAYKNIFTGVTGEQWHVILADIKLLAGDYVDVRPSSSVTYTGGTLDNLNSFIAIDRIGNY